MPRKPTGNPRGRPSGTYSVLQEASKSLTVRLPLTLYDRLETYAETAHGWIGKPDISRVVRELLEQVLPRPYSRKTENIPAGYEPEGDSHKTQNTTAAVQPGDDSRKTGKTSSGRNIIRKTEKYTAPIQGRDDIGKTENLDDRAIIRQTEKSTDACANTRKTGNTPLPVEPDSAAPAPEDCPPYDPRRHRLGALCPAGHGWGTTGQSLRANNRAGYCLACNAAQARARRQAKRPGARKETAHV